LKTLTDQLAQYAAYHRDSRNIATHLIGIPMIVLAVSVLLARLGLETGGLTLNAAQAVALVTGLYYLRLDARLGVLMCALLGLAVAFGSWVAAMTATVWALVGFGGFVVGWIIQFVGHAWEGRKPAFVDDLMGLVIGPLFVACEVLFMLQLRLGLRDAIEDRVGPARHRGRAGAH